jgi:hypothetical protein
VENVIGLASDQPTFVFLSPKTAKLFLAKPVPAAIDTHVALCSSDMSGQRLSCVFRPTQRTTGLLGVDDEGIPDGRKFYVSGLVVNGKYQFGILRSDLHSFASFLLDHDGGNSEAMFGDGYGYYCDDGIEAGSAIRYFGRIMGIYGMSRQRTEAQVVIAASFYARELDKMIADAKEVSRTPGKC